MGLGIAFYFTTKVKSVPIDLGIDDEDLKARLIKIHSAIQKGAMAFLKQEYKFMAIFMVVFAIIIVLFIDDHHTDYVNEGIYTALAFLFGAIISIASGYIGMKIATVGNVRTTVSANQSLAAAFKVAVSSGAVMGFTLVSLATIGLIVVYVVLKAIMPEQLPTHVLMEVIAGFGLGGSSIALFARVGGGIFTKAADVGADLVGKVEAGIPEEDPRNPAVIADNVGDNVGDVAGMGADLFGS
ncbi:MAG: sodium/proton-translocating pyrophosphatase, partial [Gammaproteobacteria bacterium]|nr:sodium/proton-translocating pyrophosphatase [Gammaproteobacteria bacterium]